MELTKYKLGKLIEQCDNRNTDEEYTADDVRGISTGKEFIETKANIETLAKIACKRTEYVKRIYFNYKIDKVADFEKKIYGMNDIEFVYLGEGQKIYL